MSSTLHQHSSVSAVYDILARLRARQGASAPFPSMMASKAPSVAPKIARTPGKVITRAELGPFVGSIIDGGLLPLPFDPYHAGVTYMEDDPAAAAAPNALYPTNLWLNWSTVRFHLRVWAAAEGNHVWRGVDRTNGLANGRLTFTSAVARQRFYRWWNHYQKLLYRSEDVMVTFLPLMRFGPVSGFFIQHQTQYDRILAEIMRERAPDSDRLIAGLNDCISFWGWVSVYCKAPVVRTLGGWVFSRKSDVAKFLLTNDAETNAAHEP